MARISMLVSALAAVGVVALSCSKDEHQPAPKLGNLGDVCQATSDCAGTYVCRGSQCTASTTGISPNDNVCRLVQCTKAEDCCVQQLTATQCQSYADDCEAGMTTYCEIYNQYCICDTARRSCTEGTCTSNIGCAGDMDCTSSVLDHCDTGSGRCVACTQDSHCGTGYICAGNACDLACDARSDCAAFYDC